GRPLVRARSLLWSILWCRAPLPQLLPGKIADGLPVGGGGLRVQFPGAGVDKVYVGQGGLAGIHQGYIVTGEVTPDEGGAAQVFKLGGGHVDTAARAHADVTEARAAGAER